MQPALPSWFPHALDLPPQLKQRLTGAALLVLVVVLLVPEMFRGRPGDAAPTETARGQGPAERSYTIDLRPTGASTPLVANPTGATEGSTALPGAAPAAVSATTPAPAPAPTSAPAPVSAPAATSAPSQPAAAPAVVPRGNAAMAPVAQAPVVAATRKAPQAGEWVVQVGSFAHADLARQMVKQVHARGFAVEAVGPDDRGLYRVRSPPFRDREGALALKARMVEKGLKPIVAGVH